MIQYETFETKRLTLRLASQEMAAPLLDYYWRNRDFLRDFDPLRSDEFYTNDEMSKMLAAERTRAETGASYRYYLFPHESPNQIIGMTGLNNIVYGAFLSCFLSYKLDEKWLGRGLAPEAVSCAIEEIAFRKLRLHRVEANIMPKNARSVRVAQKCGMSFEGMSPRYLLINGVWEDHAHFVRLNESL